MDRYDSIILGAGATGLAAAYSLLKEGKSVLIVDKSKDVGGLLYSIKVGNSFVEAFYHHLFSTDTEVMEMMRELGMEHLLEWKYATTAFLFDEGLFLLTKPQDILDFKPLNFFEKINFIQLMLKIKLTKNIDELDDVSAKDWIIENSSKGLYEKMFHPLLKSKFDSKLSEISAAWFIERINLRGKRNLRGEKLGYIKGGFHELIEKLAGRVKELNGQIMLGSSIEKIGVNNRRIEHIIVNGKKVYTKTIISTIPPSALLGLCNFPKGYSERISNIEYQGSLIVFLVLKRKITDYYWVNILPNSHIGAIIEHTNFQPVEVYGNHIAYLAKYPDLQSNMWKKSDKGIFELYFEDLKRLFPHIKDEDVVTAKIFRGREAGVVYNMGFKKNMINNSSPIKGLFMGGVFNMYPERSTHLAFKFGKKCANLALKYLSED